MRPLLRLLAEHSLCIGLERIDAVAELVVVGRVGVRRLVRRCSAAGREGDPGVVARHRADQARRELRVGGRPDAASVERHLVRRRRARLEPVHDDEPVVVAADVEGVRAGAEDLDLARRIGLDPDDGVAQACVPQQRPDHELRHQ